MKILFINEIDKLDREYMPNIHFDTLTSLEKISRIQDYQIVILLLKSVEIVSLEKAKRLKTRCPNCKIIFISTNEDYTFFSVASKYQVDIYLLSKNIQKELETNVMQLIESANVKRDNYYPVQDHIFFYQQDFLFDVIRGENFTPEELRKGFEALKIRLDTTKNYWLLGLNIDKNDEKKLDERKQLLLESKKVIERNLDNYHYLYASVTLDKRSVVWFIQAENGISNNFLNYLEIDRGFFESHFKTKTFLVLSKQSIEWKNTTNAFSNVRNHLLFVEDKSDLEVVTGLQAEMDVSTSEENYERFDAVMLLSNYLDCGQEKEFNQLLRSQLKYLLSKDRHEVEMKLELYHWMCAKLLSYLNYSNMKEAYLNRFNNLAMFELSYAVWDESLYAYFMEFSKWIFSYIKDEAREREEKLIGSIHVYIGNHMDQDLSLQRLADLVYLNPVYLSRIYKQITGKNLSEYITNQRIIRAAELLARRELKINEIAKAVGYDSPAHFSRTFKKAMNQTPLEYREKLKQTIE